MALHNELVTLHQAGVITTEVYERLSKAADQDTAQWIEQIGYIEHEYLCQAHELAATREAYMQSRRGGDMTKDIEPRVMTREQAGVILGGEERPYSKYVIERLVTAGKLVAIGVHKNRRITRRSVMELARQLEQGVDIWQGAETKEAVAVKAASIRTSRASGGRKSQMDMGERSGVVRLVAKPPKRFRLK